MQFTFADPELVVVAMLKKIQVLGIVVNYEYADQEIDFPKENPVVHIQLMRVSKQQICVDFCRVG